MIGRFEGLEIWRFEVMLIEMEELWCGGDGGFFNIWINIWWGLDWLLIGLIGRQPSLFTIHFYFTIPLS